MPPMFAHSPTKGRTQRGQHHGSKEQSSHEQKAVHRADGRAHRLAKGRSQKTPGSFHDDHIGSAQGGRGGTVAWLREVLRQGAEGEGRQKPADRREDADRGPEGSGFQGGQGPQGVRLVSTKASRWASTGSQGWSSWRLQQRSIHPSAWKVNSANFAFTEF